MPAARAATGGSVASASATLGFDVTYAIETPPARRSGKLSPRRSLKGW
jgi:hypothetical protein